MAKGQMKSTREAKKPKKAVSEKPPAATKTAFGAKISGTSYSDFYRERTKSNS